jgi:hypothetical protein
MSIGHPGWFLYKAVQICGKPARSENRQGSALADRYRVCSFTSGPASGVGRTRMMRRVLWVGAGAATAARILRRAYRARREVRSNSNRLAVHATVAPEVVADLTDLLRRVTGRAENDRDGAITVKLAPGVDRSEFERDLRAVIHRWSEMHPGIRVRVTDDDQAPKRRRATRRAVETQERAETAAAGTLAAGK